MPSRKWRNIFESLMLPSTDLRFTRRSESTNVSSKEEAMKLNPVSFLLLTLAVQAIQKKGVSSVSADGDDNQASLCTNTTALLQGSVNTQQYSSINIIVFCCFT